MKHSLLALTLLAAVPALALSATASAAEGVSYNYVEGGYVASNGDGDFDADGAGVNASFAISPNFHLFGGYSAQKSDAFDIDTGAGLARVDGVDVDQWRLGVGYNQQLAPKVDLVARAAYEKAKVDDVTIGGVNYGGGNGDGYSAEVGVRSALASKFEGYAMAGYADGDNADGDFYGRLGAQVKFNPNWGVSGDVKFASGDTSWFVGPRFTW